MSVDSPQLGLKFSLVRLNTSQIGLLQLAFCQNLFQTGKTVTQIFQNFSVVFNKTVGKRKWRGIPLAALEEGAICASIRERTPEELGRKWK